MKHNDDQVKDMRLTLKMRAVQLNKLMWITATTTFITFFFKWTKYGLLGVTILCILYARKIEKEVIKKINEDTNFRRNKK